jgi:hypothetical protein
MLADTKILARDESSMHGRGLATSANMTQTVCDTVFLHSCAMQRWNPSSDAPPVPPSAAAVDVVRGGDKDEFIGSQLALNRKGFYAALCRVAAHMRATDPLPDALADLLRYDPLCWRLFVFMTRYKATTYCPERATWMESHSSGGTRRTKTSFSGRILLGTSGHDERFACIDSSKRYPNLNAGMPFLPRAAGRSALGRACWIAGRMALQCS